VKPNQTTQYYQLIYLQTKPLNMLALNPVCEHCARSLPPNSTEARICSFECTFCVTCVEEVLHNVCPNCGGGFEKRPVRPAGKLKKYPATTEMPHRPVDMAAFSSLLLNYRQVPPEKR
jgi:uncharacterized protein